MAQAGPVRIVLAEDHMIVRQGVRALLQTYPNIEVVGEAGDGEEAVAKVAKLQPTIVVMDITMPRLDGIAATRLIKTNHPHIAVIGLSLATHGYNVDAMLKAGAFEVLPKEKAVHDLYGAIQRAVASNQPIFVLEEAGTSTMPAGALEETAGPGASVSAEEYQTSKQSTQNSGKPS
ncbi:MAG TPA: response regulator transcription factor [Nitrospira sp.]